MKIAPSKFRRIGHIVTGGVMAIGGVVSVGSFFSFREVARANTGCDLVLQSQMFANDPWCLDIRDRVNTAKDWGLVGVATVAAGGAGFAAVSFIDEEKQKSQRQKINGPRIRVGMPETQEQRDTSPHSRHDFSRPNPFRELPIGR